MKKEIKPVLTYPDCVKPCKTCGHTQHYKYGNTRPGDMMDYMLLTHPEFLRHSVIDNVDYINSRAYDSEKKCLRLEDRE